MLTRPTPRAGIATAIGAACLLAGLIWLAWSGSRAVTVVLSVNSLDTTAGALTPGTAVSVAGPVLSGTICRSAEPGTAPASPPCRPDDVLEVDFTWEGTELWLALDRANVPAGLRLIVDQTPASELRRFLDSKLLLGTIPLLSPWEHPRMRPETEWILAHRSAHPGVHTASLTIWQAPWVEEAFQLQDFLSGAASDPGPVQWWPTWPGGVLALLGLACWTLAPWRPLAPAWRKSAATLANLGIKTVLTKALPTSPTVQGAVAAVAAIAITVGTMSDFWWLALSGLGLLGLLGTRQPVLWLGLTLAGLPFHLHPLPLAPGLALNLVEIGAWGGFAVTLAHVLVFEPTAREYPFQPCMRWVARFLFLAIGLALVSALAADYLPQAIREWRTVFLAGGVFLASLLLLLHHTPEPERAAQVLIGLWMTGAVAISLFSIVAWTQGIQVTEVEGVRRARGLFGSPNNLALYLERCVLVALAMLGFAASWKWRLAWGLSAALTAGTVLLTFSKGALFLGLPIGGLTILLAAIATRPRWPEARWLIWILAGTAATGLAALAPFLDTPRMSGVLNWRESFPALVRVHLWRSSLAMFADYWWLGVGPDNFLYWYRGVYVTPEVWNEPSLNHPHNIILDLLTRLGLPGFLIGLALAWVAVGGLLRQLSSVRPRPMAVAALGACTAGIAHGMVDASYALPELWMTWGLLLTLGLMHRQGAEAA
ncbi:MAG: O-antigen ligase family protein [Caldilineaceae bacterium]|nr:O-antigen ligase family protein [Caldilineaceae bacterium]